ncbi:MAG: tRNA pseudouridine(55) synthase TruB [Chloroflexota bacterium]|nr:tRNA pseudouridine(55) synthase TruB [Chloroflexota bacterium]
MAKVRGLAAQKRVGHAGTLDPLAEGVLPVLLGRATRLADVIQPGPKTYLASVHLGSSTDTDDREGTLIREQAVPALTGALVEAALDRFRGEILQTPPQYSAVKVAGRRAYAVARSGGEVALAPRPVTVYSLGLIEWSPTHLALEVTCSRGTYIRALARDIAVQLGTLGHLTTLVRTRVGPFRIEDALTLEDIAAIGVQRSLLSASCALPTAAGYSASADEAARLANGQALAVAGVCAESVWVYDPLGKLVCLASADGALLRSRLAL